MTKNQLLNCPDCQAEIPAKTDAQKGEIITCPDCGTDLEIIKTKPFEIAKAPETQDDWGE